MVVPTEPAPMTLIFSLHFSGGGQLGATWVIKAFTVVVIILKAGFIKNFSSKEKNLNVTATLTN